MGATRLASGTKAKAHRQACNYMLSVSLYLVHAHCFLLRDEAAEKTDAGRVAPISVCVFYQTDRLKSKPCKELLCREIAL